MELQDVEVVAEGLLFPEGPVAMPDGSVVVCEITGGRLSRIGPGGDRSIVAEVGGGPNGAAIGPDGALYVCNNGGFIPAERITPSIQRVDPSTGEVTPLYSECNGQSFRGPNDLVFDPTGNFWFTDFAGNAIYYASPDGGSINRVIGGLQGPNGVGLSPDGDVVYWAQTFTRQVHRRKVRAPGQVEESPQLDVTTLVAGLTPDPWTMVVGLGGVQELDSLAVEAGGRVCVGTLIDAGITVVDPTDGSYELMTLPAQLEDGVVTNICFAGADMQTAYITCSATGRLVSCRWPRPGLKLAYPVQAD